MEKIKEVVLSVQTLLGSQSEVLLFSGQTNNFTEIVSGKSAPRSMKGEPTGLFPSSVWKHRKFIFYATLKILCALIYPKHITTIFFTDFFFLFCSGFPFWSIQFIETPVMAVLCLLMGYHWVNISLLSLLQVTPPRTEQQTNH